MKINNHFKTALFFTLACLSHHIYAQNQEKALAHVVYEFVHVTDTNQRDKPRKEAMILYLGTHHSVYKSQTLALKLEEMKKQIEEGSRDPMRKNALFFSSPNVSNQELFLFPQQQNFFTCDKLGTTDYIIREDYPLMDWQINNETKTIGGYACQQATTSFGGRIYTAWFTEELPFPYGPWKLHGLPGLILQATDDKQEVQFIYAGFDKNENDAISISLPANGQKTTAEQFAKAKDVFDRNFASNWKNNLPANAKAKLVIKDQSGREISPDEFNALQEQNNKDQKNRFNNPLERKHP